jgi:hypothetical protein
MSDRHEHLDEGTIHAWLDGALAPDESARVESATGSCAECAALVAEARGLIAASSRILSSLDAVPAGVIPGSSADVDQLAALRARRRATSRRWWQDRRVAVAASLVFVAGISSLVLRSDEGESARSLSQVTAESASSAPVVAPAPAPAPANTVPAVAREADAREAKVAASSPPPPATSTVRERTAADVRIDSAATLKASPASAPVIGAVANEARRSDTGSVGRVAADSIAPLRQELATSERQLRQQGSPRQAAPQQFRVDSLQQAPARAAALGSDLRRSVVTAGAGAAMADAAGPGGGCYRIRGLTSLAVADTIRLLNVMAPALSDPSWFRTQIYGALRDTTLAWRSVGPSTVELRARFGSDTAAVRFRIDDAPPDNRSVPGVRTASALRIACPR